MEGSIFIHFQSPIHPSLPPDVPCTTTCSRDHSIERARNSSNNQEEMMEVEGLDGATASLIFFVVVAILVFGCLQVVVGFVESLGVQVRWYGGRYVIKWRFPVFWIVNPIGSMYGVYTY